MMVNGLLICISVSKKINTFKYPVNKKYIFKLAASDLAGCSEVDFIRLLSSFNVSIFDLSDEDLVKDIQNA